MPSQTRKWSPSDAANIFIRVILSDAGVMLGGLSDEQWLKTLEWFDGRCAYTDQLLAPESTDRDHAIPMNREHCGLHLYGNVLPATKDANQQKGSKHYREFVQDGERLERIEALFEESGYWDRIADLGDVQRYCEAQYQTIVALCGVNKVYLKTLLPQDVEEEETELPAHAPEPTSPGLRQTLPIELDPVSTEAFKTALLRKKRAWIVEFHRNGQRIVRPWDAFKMSATSNVLNNLRSRPRYRSGNWQQHGIERIRVSIEMP